MKKVLCGGFIFISGILLCCFSLLSMSNMIGNQGHYNETLWDIFGYPIMIGILLAIIGLIFLIIGMFKSEK